LDSDGDGDGDVICHAVDQPSNKLNFSFSWSPSPKTKLGGWSSSPLPPKTKLGGDRLEKKSMSGYLPLYFNFVLGGGERDLREELGGGGGASQRN